MAVYNYVERFCTSILDLSFCNTIWMLYYIRVAHSSVFSVIFASFSVPFFMKFGGRFVNLAGKNGTKNAVKNDEKWLLWVLPPPKTPKMSEKRVSKIKTTFRRVRHSSSSAWECCNFVMPLEGSPGQCTQGITQNLPKSNSCCLCVKRH